MEIRKQLIRFSLFVAFLFVMFLLPAAAPTAPAKGGASYTDEQLGAIARLTSRLFENSHYRPQALDTQFSHQLFDAYFDLLDPNHISFTAKDVAEFLPERDLLASNLKAGKVDFAFRVYDLFRRRNREFRIFAEERLKTPVDFTSDETFVPDRRKLPRPADEKERLSSVPVEFACDAQSREEMSPSAAAADGDPFEFFHDPDAFMLFFMRIALPFRMRVTLKAGETEEKRNNMPGMSPGSPFLFPILLFCLQGVFPL